MAQKRTARVIQEQEFLDYLFSVKPEDYTSTFFATVFGDFSSSNKTNRSKYEPYDLLTIPAGIFGNDKVKNQDPILTTLGLYIFNRYIIEPVSDILGYINRTLNKKGFVGLVEKLKYALIEDKIDIDQFHMFLLKVQKLMPFCIILASHVSMDLLTLPSKIEPQKKKLLDQYKDELSKGDTLAVSKIESELLKIALDEIGEDPCMDLYYSGTSPALGNDFKNMYLFKGAVKNIDNKEGNEYNVITSCYINGVSKDEYHAHCASLAAGPYCRAGKTQVGGHWEKLFIRALQHLQVGPKGSDCGTTHTITITLTPGNIHLYMYSYIKEGSKLIELNSENVDKYLGKSIKIRFSGLCEYSKNSSVICNKCMGELPFRLGVQNIGSAMPVIPSQLKNICMKKFHNSQVKLQGIDFMEAFDM